MPIAATTVIIASFSNQDAAIVLGVTDDLNSCAVYDNLEEKILDIRPRDAYKFGISRSNLICIQKKIRENGIAKLHKKTLDKITRCLITKGGEMIN